MRQWNQIKLIHIKSCWLLRRGENRSARRRTSRSREENLLWESNLGHNGGRRVLSPLCYPCSLLPEPRIYGSRGISTLKPLGHTTSYCNVTDSDTPMNTTIYMGYWPSLFGQDGWILAKFFAFFACLWTIKYGIIIKHQKMIFDLAGPSKKPRAGSIVPSCPLR